MRESKDTEKQLLEATKQGRTEAFEQIILRYQSLVCAITFSSTGRQDLSEELAQESFLQAWRCLGQLNDLGKFRSWLCSITRSVILNYLRKKRKDLLQGAEAIQPSSLSTTAESTPASQLISREEQMMLQQAILRIPEAYREPLVLFYRQQQSIRQVADLLDLNEQTVRTRLHRGRQMLKEEVSVMVERNLEKTAPGPGFTKAVMLAIGGLAVGTFATTEAAASTGASSGIAATILTGASAKIAILASAVVIGVGGYFVYQRLSDSKSSVEQVSVVQEVIQESTSDIPIETVRSEPQKTAPSAPLVSSENMQGETVPFIPKTTEIGSIQETPTEFLSTATSRTERMDEDGYQFHPRGALSGLITDFQTGDPVTDAEVQIYINRYLSAKTDPNGFYCFDEIKESGNYRISIHSMDYIGLEDYDTQPMVYLEKDEQIVQHFQLSRACKVEVFVNDENGEPVHKADVHAACLSDDRRREIGDSIYAKRTDEKGRFLLGGFPPNGTYLITVTHSVRGDQQVEENGRRYYPTYYDFAPGHAVVMPIDPNQIETVEVILEKGMSIQGLAMYKDGLPAEGLNMVAYPEWWHSNYCPKSYPIDPNGFFTLEHIIPGSYRIQVDVPSGDGSSTGYSLFQTTLPPAEGDRLEVTVPFHSPENLVAIRGSIHWIGDQRPSSLRVEAYSRTHGHHSVHLDSDQEEFVVDRLEPGTYRLSFEGSDLEYKVIENVTAPCEGLMVELQYAAKPKLLGIVLDAATKEPIRQFRVRSRKLQTLRGANYVQNDRWTSFVKDNGTFEIEAIGPGVYQVQADAEGYAPRWSEEINTDQNKAVLLSLTPGGTITGQVVDPLGIPVKGAAVIPLSRAAGTMPRVNNVFVSKEGAVKTDNRGQFILTHLPPGLETLKADHPEYAFAIKKDIPVVEGQMTDDVKIILSRGGIIEGFIYDSEGNPEEGAFIYAQDDSGYGGSGDEEAGRLGIVQTDPNGFYRIVGLPEKMCYLRRRDSAQVHGVVRRTVLPANGQISRVDFGSGPVLSGQIVLADQPLADKRVLLSSTTSPHFGYYMAYGRTDTEGRFAIRGVIPGRFAVYKESENRRGYWDKLTVVACGREDMDLGVIPQKTVKVWIALQSSQPALWQNSMLYLTEPGDLYVSSGIQVKPPAESGGYYLAEAVEPGLYQAVLYRSDNVIFRQTLEIPDGQSEVSLPLLLPECSASISGQINMDSSTIMLWKPDQTILAYTQKGSDNTYAIRDLPYGQYRIGSSMAMEEAGSIPVDLLPGQQLVLNLDESQFQQTDFGLLEVTVVDENGWPLENTAAYLQAKERIVEPKTSAGWQIYFITAPGSYVLHVSAPGHESYIQDFFIEKQDSQMTAAERQKITVRMRPVSEPETNMN